MNTPTPETEVPNDETPARCPYCERPFRTDRARALHLGDRHRTVWTDDERAAHDAAADDESDDLFVFHLKIVATLTLLYAGFVLGYMVVLGTG